jgi:hypothetical protein
MPSQNATSRYLGSVESDGVIEPIYVTEANEYYVGQVLPPGDPHAGCFVQSIRRTKREGPLARRYMIDWINDADGTQGTFVSWK